MTEQFSTWKKSWKRGDREGNDSEGLLIMLWNKLIGKTVPSLS